MSLFSLKNKTAIITGGASGIGLAITRMFIKQGATVHIFDLNKEQVDAVVEAIKKDKGKAYAYVVDVTNQKQVVTIVNKIAAKSRIDILINNAGIAHIGTAENTNEADFERVLNVNVKGAYNCLYAVIPHLKSGGGGVIINMASIAATLGIPDRFAYSMSKGAIISMTYSVAKDFIKDNIRCNCISPARVHTPFVDGFIAKNYAGREAEMFEKLSKTQPIGRMAEPEEVAAMAVYLCSDEANFLTGCDYPVDGGFIKLNN